MTANNNVPAAAIGGQRPGTPGGAEPSATPPQSPPGSGFVADGTSARPGVRAWAGRDAKTAN